MKKKVLSALLCAAMVVSMTACGLKAPETADTTTSQTTDAAAATDAAADAAATEASDSTGTEPVGPAVTLVYAEVNPLEGTIVGQTATAFKEKVEELSGGSITIDIQANGVLGAESDVLDTMLGGGGTIDMARISAFALTSYGGEKSSLLSVPFTFVSRDHFWNFATSDLAQEFLLEPHENGTGIRGLFYGEEGFRHFFTVNPIEGMDDLAGMKIRVSESDLMLKMMESLGGVGVGLPFNDTYSSIQTGVVDGAENNMTSYIEMSFYEVAPYWTYDGHSYMPDMILASKQTMDKLSADDQQIIFDCAKEAEEWHRTAWEESEAKNAKIAEEKGCTLTTLTDDELKQFQDAVAPMYDSFLNDEQKAIVERVKALA